jgi:hypothetical protein
MFMMSGKHMLAGLIPLRMSFFWDVTRVALVRTDVSEEHVASIIRVTRIGELGAMLAIISNGSTLQRNTMLLLIVTANVVPSSPIPFTLMMETIHSFEKSVLTRTTRRNTAKDDILHGHRRENLKSYL